MKLQHANSIIIQLFLLTFFSCKPSVPKDVLPMKEMEKILYDYHLAQGLAETSTPDSTYYYRGLYETAVFSKYGINKETFDHSMIWYERHTDKLEEIYKNISGRLGNASNGHNSNANMANSLSGDTINIWQSSNICMLHSQGRNYAEFTQQADTALQTGDCLTLNFTPIWYYHEGERQAKAMLCLFYENDSVAVRTVGLYGSGQQSLSVTIGDKKVERIQVLFYQKTGKAKKPRILLLNNISLCRIRRKETELKPDQNNNDTLKVQTINGQKLIRDSLLRADTLEKKRPHFQR